MVLLYICFVIFVLTLSNVYTLEVIDGRIKISIVTTSGCSDTVDFIRNQLADAYWEYREFIELEFIPWGRTRYKGDGTMVCQFGPNDCWANRVHRCALAMLRNQDDQVSYMTCEFSSPNSAYLKGRFFCANDMNINLDDMDTCVNTNAGEYLDNAAEEKARFPMKIIDFVPAIYFNDIVDQQAHNRARTRLKSMICFALAKNPGTGVTDCGLSRVDKKVWIDVRKDIEEAFSEISQDLRDYLL